MNNKIRTYEDLLKEEQRLKAHLHSYKVMIKDDISGFKAALNPLRKIGNTLWTFTNRYDNGTLLNFGLNASINIFLRRILFGRAGWVAKEVLPYIIKNYASHLITEDQRKTVAESVNKFLKKFMVKKKKEPFEAASSNGT